MPQLAPMTINDGQATPVAHTFYPVGIDANGVATLVDRFTGIAVGYPSITMALKYNRNSRVYRATTRVMVPTLEVIGNSSTGVTPPATKAYDCSAHTEYTIPERASLVERKNIRAYNANLQAHLTVQTLVESLESQY